MENEKEREAFEKWWGDRYSENSPLMNCVILNYINGDHAFYIWQAALASKKGD